MALIPPPEAPPAPTPNDTDVTLPAGAHHVANQPEPAAPPHPTWAPAERAPARNSNGHQKTTRGTRPQHAWWDPDAEHHLAADLMVYPHHLAEARTLITPGDLSPAGARLYQAVIDLAATGDRFDSGVIARHLNDHTLISTLDGAVTGAWRPYARHLADLAHRRHIRHAADELAQAATDGDPGRIEHWRQQLADTATTAAETLPHPPLGEFLNTDEPEYDWIIEGLLEHGDRVLLTGPEGGGKSTLLRQIGVQAAAGIHPFTLDDIQPLTVVLIDLENSTRFLRRTLRPLHAAAHQTAADRLHIVSHPQGLDLTDPDDRQALTNLIDNTRPDLLLGGPVYKLVGGDPTEEGPAKAAAALLDQLRVRHGFAVALETHQPHETSGSKQRPERPYGASLWKRWPEFGLHLADRTYELRHWRGDRDTRTWPPALQRGGEWPWTITTNRLATFARMCEEVRTAGRPLSLRDLAERLETSKNQIDRAIKANKPAWDALLSNSPATDSEDF